MIFNIYDKARKGCSNSLKECRAHCPLASVSYLRFVLQETIVIHYRLTAYGRYNLKTILKIYHKNKETSLLQTFRML